MHHVLGKKHRILRTKGKEFITYFRNTYLGTTLAPARFPMEMWNHYDNHDERTNNRVEGDNNKMKNYCGAASPQIDKAVELLRTYEITARDKYNNAKI